MAEWWYNSSPHSALKMFPFEALYGYSPPSFTLKPPTGLVVDVVDQFVRDRQHLSQLLRRICS